MSGPSGKRVLIGLLLTGLAVLAGLSRRTQISASQPQPESFLNFESGPVRPLALTPSGNLLLALNTPDNRLEVFRVGAEGLERAGETVVGLEPVALAVRGEAQAFVVNHLSDSVSVVNLSDPELPYVSATLQTGDEPRDIVLGGPARNKLFVTAASRGQNRPQDPLLTQPGVGRADVWVWDVDDLERAPEIVTLFADTPRALAVTPDGSRVYAASFHSGNQTTVLASAAVSASFLANAAIADGFQAPGMAPPLENAEGVAAPLSGLILQLQKGRWVDSTGRDWTPRVRFNLPDHDVFVLDATVDPPVETESYSGVGTILFNMAVHPVNGELYVSNLESRNLVRFEPVLNGHLAENRVTVIGASGVRPVHLNPHIDYSSLPGPASEIAQSLAFPLDMAFSRDGQRLFLTAFGSAKVAVLDAGGSVLSRIDVGGGPCGLALHEGLGRLFVLNRFDLTISIVDTESLREVGRKRLAHNPEPAEIRQGRPLLYDARLSGHGDSACASCHIFGDLDSLAWDLGDPDGVVEDNPLEAVEVQFGGLPLTDFHPIKGPMTTQSLRGMRDAGAMHWRGDRNGGHEAPFDSREAFMAFRPAFEKLLGGEELERERMQAFADFALTLRYPPNPIAPLDGSLTPPQERGRDLFNSSGERNGPGGDGDPCFSCHTLPLGADGRASFEGLTQDMKVPHLRNLYQKVGMFGYALPSILEGQGTVGIVFEERPTAHLGDQVRGFGYLHDGSIPNLFNFFRFPLQIFTFRDEPERTGSEKVRDLEAFLLAFPTGLAPIVGQQLTLGPANLEESRDLFELYLSRVRAGDGDLVLHGILRGRSRGFLLEARTSGDELFFHTDREAQIVDWGLLEEEITTGGLVLTATIVPPGSGRRIGIDRDDDGVLDGDEPRLGSDPRPGWTRRR